MEDAAPPPLFLSLSPRSPPGAQSWPVTHGDLRAAHVRLSACDRGPRGRDWVLERRMREEPLRQFRAVWQRYGLDAPERVLAIGSDADEIARGEAVYRLARCELRPGLDLDERIVYFGTLSRPRGPRGGGTAQGPVKVSLPKQLLSSGL